MHAGTQPVCPGDQDPSGSARRPQAMTATPPSDAAVPVRSNTTRRTPVPVRLSSDAWVSASSSRAMIPGGATNDAGGPAGCSARCGRHAVGEVALQVGMVDLEDPDAPDLAHQPIGAAPYVTSNRPDPDQLTAAAPSPGPTTRRALPVVRHVGRCHVRGPAPRPPRTERGT